MNVTVCSLWHSIALLTVNRVLYQGLLGGAVIVVAAKSVALTAII